MIEHNNHFPGILISKVAGLLITACIIHLSLGAQLHYKLIYKDSISKKVTVSITIEPPMTGPVSLVMPRSIPGGYGIYNYDQFIEQPVAISDSGNELQMIKDENDAPRWHCRDSGIVIHGIRYQVDLNKMERKMLAADASIIRSSFVGILNYSILGWIDGYQDRAVRFEVATFDDWPIFSTNKPAGIPAKGSYSFTTENYFALADGQVFIGPKTRVKEYKGAIPVFIASYCESEDEFLDDYGQQVVSSIDILKNYFGAVPFQHYSFMLRKAIPLEPGNAPSLAMEHLASSSFFGDTSFIRRQAMNKDEVSSSIFPILHHIGHAFIPLRCYGDKYKPTVLEIPPIINNIWFNEGFIWFLTYDTLKLERMKMFFERNVYRAPPEIKKLGLLELSQAASTMYGTDFRIGRSTFSRGALMAIEMNDFIKKNSAGKRSMKDVLRFFYQWSETNKRAFTLDEFPQLLNKAAGMKLDNIYAKWLLPVK